jgi:hypothetical protein
MRHHHLLVASALAVAASLSACSEGRAEASGPTVSRSYPVGGFTGIEVAGPFDVRVTTGKAVAVAASGPQKLLDETEVLVKDGKLMIRPKKKGWFGGMSWNSRQPSTFTISVPTLDSVRVAGSGDINVDRITGERFSGAIAGSGDLRLAQVAVREIGLSIAGSGGITVAGQAQKASYEIAGSGDVDASGLKAADAEAEIAGSGSIRANVTGNAKASIAGSGDIDIRGGARCQSSKNGSGEIRCS